MKKSLGVTAIIVVGLLEVSSTNCKKCSSYYWRDYTGDLPEDAIIAGRNDDETIYIGQVYIRGFELLPATIHPNLKIATTNAYGKVFHVGKYIKILCGKYPAAFKWLPITSNQLSAVQNVNHLISGGSEVGENLFISRNLNNRSYVIGKVFGHDRKNRGSWYWLNNHSVNVLSYEVLSYDCNSEIPDIDIRTE